MPLLGRPAVQGRRSLSSIRLNRVPVARHSGGEVFLCGRVRKCDEAGPRQRMNKRRARLCRGVVRAKEGLGARAMGVMRAIGSFRAWERWSGKRLLCVCYVLVVNRSFGEHL